MWPGIMVVGSLQRFPLISNTDIWLIEWGLVDLYDLSSLLLSPLSALDMVQVNEF